MMPIPLFLSACLWFVPAFMNAQSFSEYDIAIVAKEQQVSTSSYLNDLQEQGYCIIPQIFSVDETQRLYERVWHEFVEKAWPDCKMDDRSNWKKVFPMHNQVGIFAGPAGQTQVMWDLRQDPRIVEVFAKVWNTNDLIVSMDGLSVMCPPETREGHSDSWPHIDQAVLRRQDDVVHSSHPPVDFISESLLKTKPFTIQGQFLFEDSFEGDGGFYCIPKSHLRFNEFAPQLEVMDTQQISRSERKKARHDFLQQFFSENKDESGEVYQWAHITAPKGSLILWDSRTVHWNQHASKDRPYREDPKVRMVGYLCYVPKARLTEDGRALRREAFEKGVLQATILPI